jgi:hypothetical protein
LRDVAQCPFQSFQSAYRVCWKVPYPLFWTE